MKLPETISSWCFVLLASFIGFSLCFVCFVFFLFPVIVFTLVVSLAVVYSPLYLLLLILELPIMALEFCVFRPTIL